MRDFLRGLELDEDTIDSIMGRYGQLVTKFKEEIENYKSENENYKNQITELNNTIESNNKSLENLQQLTDENKSLKADIELNKSQVKNEFSNFVKSEVLSKVNDETDFATALEDYKKNSPQYFGETVVKKVQSSPTLTGGQKEFSTNDIMNDILRSATNDI